MGLFMTIVGEYVANRGESLQISVYLCPIPAAFRIFLTDL